MRIVFDPTICPGCDREKPKSRRICRDCLDAHGKEVGEWPTWLRLRVNDSRRWQYEFAQSAKHEIALNEYEFYEEGFGQFVNVDEQVERRRDEMGRSRKPADIPWWMDPCGEMVLPYAPYKDERANRQYRAANGIYERL